MLRSKTGFATDECKPAPSTAAERVSQDRMHVSRRFPPEGNHVIFLQPFGLGSPGGGSRILRALLQDAPVPWTSVVSSPQAPHPAPFGKELHIASRLSFGRLERSRFHSWCQGFEPLFAGLFRRRLQAACQARDVAAIHSIPHSLDFVSGWQIAKRLGLRYFLSVHDDLAFTLANHPHRTKALENFALIWRNADARFVISEHLGREYCLRFGQVKYEVITDGLVDIAEPRTRKHGRLNIYFMGLFHLSYEANLRVLLQGIEALTTKYPDLEITVTMRGVVFREGFSAAAKVKILPYGPEADVQADLREADVVYLPLPFQRREADFVRYSLSTKMVTYLGCGLPILYHGPREAAVCEVLLESGAALICDSLERARVELSLNDIIGKPDLATSSVARAAALARKRFMLADQRSRFWDAIEADMSTTQTPYIRTASPQ